MGYTEGAHDSPADTRDRLVRIGSKYQATAPAVADGDNAYLLLDAAGRVLISGTVAHDAAAVGNPVRIGGVYRTTVPAVAAGDIADLLVDTAGRLKTGLHTRHIQSYRRRGRHGRHPGNGLDPRFREEGEAAGLGAIKFSRRRS